jgi:regulator of sirC expression with transglutaminase-like and TPR domain
MQGDPERETQRSLDFIDRAMVLNPKSTKSHTVQGQIYEKAYTMK